MTPQDDCGQIWDFEEREHTHPNPYIPGLTCSLNPSACWHHVGSRLLQKTQGPWPETPSGLLQVSALAWDPELRGPLMRVRPDIQGETLRGPCISLWSPKQRGHSGRLG